MPFTVYLPLLGGIYLGWCLGANSAANCFGTAVAARIVSFRKAVCLCALTVFLGAILQGQAGIQTLSSLANQSLTTIVITTVAAALTGTIMTCLAIPISSSQAIIGAIVGIGLSCHHRIDWTVFQKIILCWLSTPLVAMICAILMYNLLRRFFARIPMSMFTRDKILWSGLLLAGTYASYALGANCVAIATGVFSGQIANVTDFHLLVIGAIAIGLGVVTFSRRVMHAVGAGIMPLDAFTALVAVTALAMTVHLFAFIGVPISNSQALVGAIVGIGIFRRNHSISIGTLKRIIAGWLMTPLISLILAAAAYAIFLP